MNTDPYSLTIVLSVWLFFSR